MLNHVSHTFAMALSAVCVGCATQAPSSHVDADSLLRVQLLERGREDQAPRDAWVEKLQRGLQPDSQDVVNMLTTDQDNTRWLAEIVRGGGWPGMSRVGREAADAAFLIVQHSPDTVFQQEMLVVISEAVTAGEASGQQLALLTDRVAVNAGQKQTYGTQAKIGDDEIVLYPIADSALVDARRAKLGLPPLGEYVRLLDSMYTKRDTIP